MSIVTRLLGISPPADEALWHRWHVFLPVRTITGHLTFGDVWRRRTPIGWEYQEYQETDDEWWARQ